MNRHGRNIAALLKNQTARRLSREERRRRAQRTRILLTYLCFLALLSLALLRLAAPVKADATQPQKPPEAAQTAFTDGRSPGDDTPALVACYMDTEQAENELIQEALLAKANAIEDCTVTWYTASIEECGKDDGITYSGLPVVEHLTCAVDPNVIPLYADVFVRFSSGNVEQYWATDTGVKGNAVDIYTPDYDYAIQCGRQSLTVWWVGP